MHAFYVYNADDHAWLDDETDADGRPQWTDHFYNAREFRDATTAELERERLPTRDATYVLAWMGG